MDKAVADYIENQQDVKSLAKENLKTLKSYSRAFRFIQIAKYNTKRGSYSFLKRAFDIMVGLIGTLCLLPIMLFVKVANLFQGDRESIIFKQKRIGKNGKEINIYKIRSMVPNAEKVLEDLMAKDPKIKEEYLTHKKLQNDPRVTKVGKFIRKTSLDEFAQFVNILKGDMTVVGPRPYLPREKEDMGEYYTDVIACKPGLTGLWQVEGRSDIGFVNRCRLDRFYKEHKSIVFDIKIFFKTFLSVLQNKGAR
ncbi:MAG: sugar transferase [Clostridia bacterium]|nr:sugar transferase [Clostridia bacterium]